ncbi:MAG: ABC transporter ATP-binding protein [Deltaproteobacteria bacterium]|nr:MAG: ABC transporter ATP-binding protein [Deltaproteobacteria bacterium]
MNAPRKAAPRASTDWSLGIRLWPFLRPHLLFFVLALLFAPASAALSIAQPYLLKVALDDHILKGDLAGTQTIALWFLGAVVLSWVTEALYLWFLSIGALRTISDLRTRVYRHTVGLSLGFFDKQPKGRLLTRVTSDIEALGETLTAGAVTIVLDVLSVLGVLIAMVWLDPWLTGVMLLLSPVVFLSVEVLRRILRRLYTEVRTSLSELNAFTTERINGVEVVQLYRDEVRSLTFYDRRLKRYRDATIRTNVYDALMYAIIDGLSSITVALILWYGSGGAVEGVLTAGLLAAFIEYVNRLFRPIQEFSAKVAVLQRAGSAMEKIFGLLDVQERVQSGEIEVLAAEGRVEIEDLRFSYGGGADVLRGISLTLAPGEVVAVVGRTGSGKTTLGRILTRAYDGYRGSVRLDGRELRELELSSARRAVGTVLQDVQIFPGDVRFNLTLGVEVDDETLWQAIRTARAEGAVDRLGGLDGRIEHKGSNLSVGEAQLLSLARTLVFDPPVVILDEATASVDTLTEALIQEAMDALLERRTVLVIAHRLSTITGSDRICLLDAGEVVEIGSHVELMRAGGAYADLFRQQFAEHDAAAGTERPSPVDAPG